MLLLGMQFTGDKSYNPFPGTKVPLVEISFLVS